MHIDKTMRVNLFLTALVVLASYATCKNLQKSTPLAPQPVDETPNYSNSGYNWKASRVIEGENADGYKPQAPARVLVPWDKISPPSTSRKSFMATGWWNIRMAYQPTDTTVHTHYVGKSLKFREDQTFDILQQDGKVQETGHWAYDDPNKILYIACKNTYFNNSWKLQENGFRMVWIGNTDINVTGIQIRMDGSKTAPDGQ
jgi:hypothetical protein